MKRFLLLAVLGLVMVLALGCGGENNQGSSQGNYTKVSAEKAAEIMKSQSGYIILDVRTPEEYKGGHIPKAVNVPNEAIGKEPPKELPDKTQMILVYCRSGRRSKEAAQKLVAMGYKNVVDFGGIMDWKGALDKS